MNQQRVENVLVVEELNGENIPLGVVIDLHVI